ncbi:MAG: radical SAM protein [Mariprofundus sp.]|nr:radical SAM protein [Mariprofundus sp.]
MPCTLVRLAGCPLRCQYCDTPQAIPTDSGQWMGIEEVVRKVVASKRPLVLVTGGEPLAQRYTIELLTALSESDCLVQLETAGAYSVENVPSSIRRIVDIKTPGSGEVDRNCLQNINFLTAGDEIKFVLTSRNDYEWSRDFIRHHRLGLNDVPVLFSPAWGEVAASDLCAWVLQDHLPVRVQIQMHKTIWGAEAEGV